MKLLVNDQAVDMQLQDEKTAWDLTVQLERWLQEQGFALTGLRIDEQNRDLAAADWRGLALDGIGSFAIEASKLSELRQANLELLRDYAEGMNQALVELSQGGNAFPRVRAHLEAYPDVRPALHYLGGGVGNGGDGDFARNLDRLVAAAKRPDGSFNPDVLPELAGQFHAMLVLAQDRLNELADPARDARSTLLILQSLQQDLSMVSTRILTGKSREAFDTILRFSELMTKLMRLFWLMIEAQSPDAEPPFSRDELQNWSATVNQTLEQITQALDSQDTVLLGDILEYELPQHIESLARLIPQAARD